MPTLVPTLVPTLAGHRPVRSIVPRIEQHRATMLHVPHVPGDQAQIMLDGRGGEQRVGHRRCLAAQALHGATDGAPAPHNRVAQRQDPAGEAHFVNVPRTGGYWSGAETLDIGSDLGSAVSPDYDPPHRFNGAIDTVTVSLE